MHARRRLLSGNLTATDGNAEGTAAAERQYTYDYRNRLLESRDRTGLKLGSYRYDGLNRRVRRTDWQGALGSETVASDVRYVYDGWRSVAEADLTAGQAVAARYVYGLAYLDEVVHMDRDADGDGGLYDDDSDGQNGAESWNVYFVQDHLYNVVGLVVDDVGDDDSVEDGTVVERAWYEAYGKATLAGADGTAYGVQSSQWGNEHLYTGQRHSGETRTAGNFGLYYYKNRYYDAGLGRFITRDPMGAAGGSSSYVYVRGRPTGDADPRGLIHVNLNQPEYYVHPRGHYTFDDYYEVEGLTEPTFVTRCDPMKTKGDGFRSDDLAASGSTWSYSVTAYVGALPRYMKLGAFGDSTNITVGSFLLAMAKSLDYYNPPAGDAGVKCFL